jgi:hypothetical protein
MKIRELFEEEQKEETLLGKKINGREITKNTPNEEWDGNFESDFKGISSLKYCPRIISGDFDCTGNRDLRSLEGSPKQISGAFICSYNKDLTSLKGATQKGIDEFDCHNCNLTSLEGAPQKINGGFYCYDNKNLTSLKGMPQEGVTDVYCSGCNLSSLEGIAKKINGDLNCFNNPNLTSLKGIHKIIEEINGSLSIGTSVKSNILGILKIKNVKELKFSLQSAPINDVTRLTQLANIINWYLPNPTTSQIIDCQNELIEAGFEEYAEL